MTRCRKCRCPIELIDGTWVVMNSKTTADGLSYCPPNPDSRGPFGKHEPKPQKKEAMPNAQSVLDHLKIASEAYLALRRTDPHRKDKEWAELTEELVERARQMGLPQEQESVVCSMLYAAEESYSMTGDVA